MGKAVAGRAGRTFRNLYGVCRHVIVGRNTHPLNRYGYLPALFAAALVSNSDARSSVRADGTPTGMRRAVPPVRQPGGLQSQNVGAQRTPAITPRRIADDRTRRAPRHTCGTASPGQPGAWCEPRVRSGIPQVARCSTGRDRLRVADRAQTRFLSVTHLSTDAPTVSNRCFGAMFRRW